MHAHPSGRYRAERDGNDSAVRCGVRCGLSRWGVRSGVQEKERRLDQVRQLGAAITSLWDQLKIPATERDAFKDQVSA